VCRSFLGGAGRTGRHPAARASSRRGGEAGGEGAPTRGARPNGGRSRRLGRAQAASVRRPGTAVAPRPSTAGAAGLGPEGHARTAPAWSSPARPTRARPRASGPSASDATPAPHEPCTCDGEQSAPAHGTSLWRGASRPGVAPASGPAPCSAAPWARGAMPLEGPADAPLPDRPSPRAAKPEDTAERTGLGPGPGPATRP
jgi:hypothetical protein